MKRFCETTRWDDPWYQPLNFKTKLVWEYVLSKCDNAGVWQPNERLASFQIGVSIDWKNTLSELQKNVVVLPCGKWWIPSFVLFQFGKLKPEANVHRSVLAMLEKHGLTDRYKAWLEEYENRGRLSSHPDGMAMGLGTSTRQGTEQEHQKKKMRAPPALEVIYAAYPRKVGRPAALRAIHKALAKCSFEHVLERTNAFAAATAKWPPGDESFIPHPATWFNQERYDDDPATWDRTTTHANNGTKAHRVQNSRAFEHSNRSDYEKLGV